MNNLELSAKVYSKTTKGYSFALLLVAGLSFMAYLTMHQVIGTHQNVGAVINESGRQRMISQRIALLAERLGETRGEAQAKTHESLAKLITTFETTHHDLSLGSPAYGIPSAAVKDLYFGAATHLDRDMQEFIASVHLLLREPPATAAEELKAHERIRELALDGILPKLNEVVMLNQKQSEQQVEKLQTIETIILFFTLTLLVVEAFFIFRPMALSITRLLKTATEAQETAINATNAKSAFLATITHEIRTPMTGVLGITEFLLDTQLSPSQRDQLLTVRRLSDTLVSLVNDILDYSKIEAGKLSIESVNFEMPLLLSDTQALFAASAQAKGLNLNLILDPTLPKTLKGDPTRLRQVLTNFVGNALKFTPVGGEITVNVKAIAAEAGSIPVRVEVIDTGVGIPEAAQAKLFARYAQADESTSRKYGGTGLGLSICKQIVELMGGTIGVISKEGQGSTFWFEMKLAPADLVMAPATPDKPRIANGVKVLLAEDNLVNQSVITTQLVKLGFEVSVANNGQEALDLVKEKTFHIVLMDCEMPQMDGFESSAAIRKWEHAEGKDAVPIVAMTGHQGEEVKARAIAAGMMGLLSKPVKTTALAESILPYLAAKVQALQNA